MKQEKEVQVDEIKREIERIELSLEKNNSIKSILYTSGDELVEQVFNIFEEMLEIDLSEFEDKNKEDFEFTISGKTFIGEIKGVKSNIKNANVSQLDVHLQEYVDSHENVDIETLFSILVMNYQNNRKPSERDQINSQQISLAQRNKSLIIDSVSLLKLLEKFRRNEISREQVIEKISDKYNGIIQV